ncbi:MAG TPA: hypothetical protein VGP87_13715 [Gemmatimonadales bacterium]|jgi:hypothetical protein|nr:hypothetical protein [Gemmatimonadales bacterium]
MRLLTTLGAAMLLGAPLAAQSSQFGTRGLGIPLSPISVRATGLGGGFSLFDAQSALNPASIGEVLFLNASFQTVQSWRHSESPAGSASISDNRYPGVFVAGPIGGTPLSVSLSASGYTDRNFVLASRDTLILRGVPVESFDTISSQGGLSDLRLAVALRQSSAIQWGVGFHMIPGSNRIVSHRAFADTTYSGASERFTYSYLGFGISAGVVARIGKYLTLAGMVRADNRVKVELDSASLGHAKLPMTFSGGARLQLGDRVLVAGSALYRNWSTSSADLVRLGGIGSVNTTELSAGVEYYPDPKRPTKHPFRFGVRHATLPFPLRLGDKTSETAVSAGTSFRFVAGRAGLDMALQQLWRKGGAGFTERATLLTLGVSVRP